MIGEDFCYNSQWLSSFGMRMYDPDDGQEFVSREIEKTEITSVRSIPNHFSTHYSDTKILSFFITKNGDLNLYQNEMVLTASDINTLRSWLESPKTPKELIVKFGTNSYSAHYFGIFTSVQPFILATDCYGLRLTFVCNAPYGFSDIFTETASISGGTTLVSKTISNTSAEKNDYLKPVITVNSLSTFNGTETLTIKNTTDDNNTMEITLPNGKSQIILDCDKKMVTDNNGSLIPLADIGLAIPVANTYNFITADRYDFYWLRLLPNSNTVTFKGSSGNHISTVVVSGRYILKSGGY